MKKQLKRGLGMSAILCMLFALTACSGSKQTQAEDAEQEVTIMPEDEDGTESVDIALADDTAAPEAVPEEKPDMPAPEVPEDLEDGAELPDFLPEDTDWQGYDETALTPDGRLRITVTFHEDTDVETGLKTLSEEILGGAEPEVHRKDEGARQAVITLTPEQYAAIMGSSVVENAWIELPKNQL